MAVLGYKVAGAVSNVGTVNFGVGNDLKASNHGACPVDGWATHLGARMGGDPLPATAALGLYAVSGGTLTTHLGSTPSINLDTTMINASGGKNYEVAMGSGVKLDAGASYAVAVGSRSGVVNFGMGPTGYTMHHKNWSGTFPNPFSADTTSTETRMVSWIVYVENAPPVAHITSHANNAVVAETSPEFTVVFNDADEVFGDGMSAAEIAVYQDDGVSMIETSGKTAASGPSFSWTPTSPLVGGNDYYVNAVVFDQHDAIGGTQIRITIGGQGTVADVATTDVEGEIEGVTVINTGTPGVTGTWDHATSEPTADLHLRILDDDTEEVVRETEDVALVVNDDDPFATTWPAAWAPLPVGTRRYRWSVSATDDLGGLSEWADSGPFVVNGPPNVPSGLTPSGSIVTSYPTLFAVCSDPTDTAALLDVTAEIRPVGGAVETIAMAVDSGDIFTAEPDATQFPSYGEYEWRVVSEDPWGLSTASGWRSLSFLAPPAITPVVPVAMETLTEDAPEVSWSVNRTQARYRVTVRERGGARVYYQSGYVQSPATTHTIDTSLPNLTDYDLVIWVETIEGSTAEETVPFSLNYVTTDARSAEEQTVLSTAGEQRAMDEVDEIVIDNVSIPVRQIQRTDTARFEGKVTFGDYTVDSDQLMSTWAQSSWVGGANVAHHIEGATDTRFRWARAWTQSNAQLTLPLASTRVDLEWSEPPPDSEVVQVSGGYGTATVTYLPWRQHPRAARPVGARNGLIYATCGKMLSAVNTATMTAYTVGELGAAPVNEGAWYGSSDYSTLRLWLPLGEHGLQTYRHQTDEINDVVDTSVPAVAVATWDTKLFALCVDGQLRIYDRTGTWQAEHDDLLLPPDETPRNLARYFDRSGNSALAIITDRQVWLYQPDADAIAPLGFEYPRSVDSAAASTVWRDDGLYVADELGITRVSTAGVITPMGLDRDDGFQITATYADMPGIDYVDAHRITALSPSTNMLLAAVRGYTSTADGVTASRNVLMGWNEAGWHYIAGMDRSATGNTAFTPCGMIIADSVDTYQAVVGSQPAAMDDDTGQSGALYIVDLPEGLHAPRQPLTEHHVAFADEGVLYTGWIDAAMANFWKAWSHVEITLGQPSEFASAPSGEVDVSYRTEADPGTWHFLGTATDFGRTVLPINTINGIDRGLRSTRIELMLRLRDTSGATPIVESPIVESVVLKFIKLAQTGAAWLVHVPLSDFDTWKGLGPSQIDDFLSRLAADGSAHGPFQHMLHRVRTEDGLEDAGVHRVRIAQWQRSEGTGRIPHGDGILNIVSVPIVPGDNQS